MKEDVSDCNCPLYVDFTRECITKFKDVVSISYYEFCDNKSYLNCPFYKLIYKIKPMCEFAEKCPMYFYIAGQDFKGLVEMTKNFCFSENYNNCARYKKRQSGQSPPKELHPNGNMIALEAIVD